MPEHIHLVLHFRLIQAETIVDSGCVRAAAETARAHTDVDLLFYLSADLDCICRATNTYSCPLHGYRHYGSLYKLVRLERTRTCRQVSHQSYWHHCEIR